MKYLAIKLIKYAQDLDEEIYKTPMNEINNLINGEIFHVYE